MTVDDARTIDRVGWKPGRGSWLVLAGLIAVGLVGNWLIAAGLVILFLRQKVRPLDFLTSYLMVVAGASFIRYEAGRLTLELSLLSVIILFTLISYVASNQGRWLALPRTKLLLPLLVYTGWSLVSYARGLFGGAPPKYATIELLPVLALTSGLLVAASIDPRRDLRTAGHALLALGYASASLGFYFSFVFRARAAGVFFTPIPGLVAMLVVNLALRAERRTHALIWGMLSVPLLLHQFLSFTRGIWLGCMAGLLASLLIYVRWGRGSGPRWRRLGLVFGAMAGVGAVAGLALGPLMGQSDLLDLAFRRLGSIGGTDYTHDTASQITRLSEYAQVIPHILASPWIGYGLGYTVITKEPIGFTVADQWYVHQIYLYVLLKQGVVGLLTFLWMLWAAVWLGFRGSARNQSPWESAWLASAAVCTIFLASIDMSNFQYAMTNSPFALALLWGGAMAIERDGFIRFRWADRDTPPLPATRDT